MVSHVKYPLNIIKSNPLMPFLCFLFLNLCVTSDACVASGDPHFNTFDCVKYEYHGKCNYTLVKNCDSSAELQFEIIGEFQRMKYHKDVSVIKSLLITCPDQVSFPNKELLLVTLFGTLRACSHINWFIRDPFCVHIRKITIRIEISRIRHGSIISWPERGNTNKHPPWVNRFLVAMHCLLPVIRIEMRISVHIYMIIHIITGYKPALPRVENPPMRIGFFSLFSVHTCLWSG